MKIEIGGFDELERGLNELKRRLQELDGEHSIPFSELFPPDLIQKHTSFETIQDLIDQSGFHVETKDDFERIPDDEWDEYIRQVSDFESWQSMINEAAQVYIVRKLGS